MTKITIEYYGDHSSKWRWRMFIGNNKRKFAVSGESFASKSNAKRAANRLATLLSHGSDNNVIVKEHKP